jgi:hypothetical protein
MAAPKEQDMTGNEPRNESGSDTQGASASATGQQIEVSSDEDWKSRVKAEDAALDQKFHKQEPEGTTPPADSPTSPPRDPSAKREESARREAGPRQAASEFPEASLVALIGMLSTQAMVALGLIPNPATKTAEKQLPLARYFIDLISVLEQKTAGNLDREEAAALDETLHTLRMAYVQFSKETA